MSPVDEEVGAGAAPHSTDLLFRSPRPSSLFPSLGLAWPGGPGTGPRLAITCAGPWLVQSVRLAVPCPGTLGWVGGLRLRAGPADPACRAACSSGVCIPTVGSGRPPGGACPACAPGFTWARPCLALKVLRPHLGVLRCPWLCSLSGVTQRGAGLLPLVPSLV